MKPYRTMCALAVCAPLAAAAQRSDAPRERAFASGEWIETARISDDAGRVLTDPRLMLARNDTVFLYDAASHEVVALAGRGRVAWRAGRAGKGPREFSEPVDMQFAPNGDIHVLDAGLSRITALTSAGQFAAMHTVEQRLHRFVPTGGGWWAVALGRPELLLRIDQRGSEVGRSAAPADIAALHVLAREPLVARTPRGSAVMAFLWSSRVLLLDEAGQLVADVTGPDRIPFAQIRAYSVQLPQTATVQRVDPGARAGARAVAANDTMALVVVAGAGADRGRVVDRYDLRTRRYVDSARLPRPAAVIQVTGARLVVLELDPAPTLVVYEWRARRPAGA
jgi:hypothetical protein